MALNIASLNARGLMDASKCAHLLAELSNLCVDVAAVQETHFICEADCRVLKDDFVVYSAFGSHLSAGVSLLVGRSLDVIVDVVFAVDGGRLLVTDVAVKTFEFRIAAVYAPNTAAIGVIPGCLFDRVQFDRQVPSGSPREGDVDMDRKFALWPGLVLPGQCVSEKS